MIFGYTFFIYIGTAFLFLALNSVLYAINGKIQLRIQKLRDKRITFLKNIFKNIRFVKFNVYENFFTKYIYDMRKLEINELKKYYLMIGVLIFLNWICPGICVSALFAGYFYFNNFMSIGTYTAFYTVLMQIEMVFRYLPYLFQAIVDFTVTFKRLKAFVDIEEIDMLY